MEGSYLQLLGLRFLPAQMQGLQEDLNRAPAGSEEKLSILRVMRMLDDASGRNKELVEQYMASRWQKAFPGQGAVQEQLMGHLDYALDHTDWHAARAAGIRLPSRHLCRSRSRCMAPSVNWANCPCISGSIRIWW